MTTLKYKDYQGAVQFEDGQLVIQLLHIDDIVTTVIDSASTAQSAFEALVDDYLESCLELGKAPSKPFKGSFNVRVTPELHRQVAWAAADADETMNAWISEALAARVERQKDRKALIDRAYLRTVIARSGNLEYESFEFETRHSKPTDPGRLRRPAIPRALEKQLEN